MQPRFGTDGLRGVANSELTPELVLALGRAAARQFPGETFLIGADTRRSSPMLRSALLSAGITAQGGQVVDLGVIPTPGLAFLARERSFPAAMISASHNPYFDNGIKLLSKYGTKLDDRTEKSIERELDALLAGATTPDADVPSGDGIGDINLDAGAADAYVAHLLSVVAPRPGCDLRVVCDCANGASSDFAARVFRGFGADVEVINASPNGTNINEQCGSTHPEQLQARVVETRADVGLCFDGDADRALAIDAEGKVIDGDHLIAMFALDLHGRGELENAGVAVTVLSNLGLRQRLGAAGITVIETPVGDRHVADALGEHGLVLGGEQSGHIIFRRSSTTGDGMLTGLKLLELLIRRRAPLSVLAAESMTRLPQVLRAVTVIDPERLADASAIWDKVDEHQAVLGTSGRVLIRPSGTEAVVRVMVEAGTFEEASGIAEALVLLVERELGTGAVSRA